MNENVDFESTLQKIEEIVKKFDDKNLTLKDSLDAYKEGAGLIKQAREILENAQIQIEHIDKDSNQDA